MEENVTKRITELIENKWMESDDECYGIILSLLNTNPEKQTEIFFFYKTYEMLCFIERRLRQIDTNTQKL